MCSTSHVIYALCQHCILCLHYAYVAIKTFSSNNLKRWKIEIKHILLLLHKI